MGPPELSGHVSDTSEALEALLAWTVILCDKKENFNRVKEALRGKNNKLLSELRDEDFKNAAAELVETSQEAAQQIFHYKYKTEMCTNPREGGEKCAKGGECTYAHTDEEMKFFIKAGIGPLFGSLLSDENNNFQAEVAKVVTELAGLKSEEEDVRQQKRFVIGLAYCGNQYYKSGHQMTTLLGADCRFMLRTLLTGAGGGGIASLDWDSFFCSDYFENIKNEDDEIRAIEGAAQWMVDMVAGHPDLLKLMKMMKLMDRKHTILHIVKGGKLTPYVDFHPQYERETYQDVLVSEGARGVREYGLAFKKPPFKIKTTGNTSTNDEWKKDQRTLYQYSLAERALVKATNELGGKLGGESFRVVEEFVDFEADYGQCSAVSRLRRVMFEEGEEAPILLLNNDSDFVILARTLPNTTQFLQMQLWMCVECGSKNLRHKRTCEACGGEKGQIGVNHMIAQAALPPCAFGLLLADLKHKLNVDCVKKSQSGRDNELQSKQTRTLYRAPGQRSSARQGILGRSPALPQREEWENEAVDVQEYFHCLTKLPGALRVQMEICGAADQPHLSRSSWWSNGDIGCVVDPGLSFLACPDSKLSDPKAREMMAVRYYWKHLREIMKADRECEGDDATLKRRFMSGVVFTRFKCAEGRPFFGGWVDCPMSLVALLAKRRRLTRNYSDDELNLNQYLERVFSNASKTEQALAGLNLTSWSQPNNDNRKLAKKMAEVLVEGMAPLFQKNQEAVRVAALRMVLGDGDGDVVWFQPEEAEAYKHAGYLLESMVALFHHKADLPLSDKARRDMMVFLRRKSCFVESIPQPSETL